MTGATEAQGRRVYDTAAAFLILQRSPPDCISDSIGGGLGGRQSIICYTCGKPGHYSRDCWTKRGKSDDSELDGMRQYYRQVLQERREAEERRREEEHRRIQEENERRREQDLMCRTEEMRLQLEAGLEEKWRNQTRKAEEAAAAAKVRAEEAKARADEARARVDGTKKRSVSKTDTLARSSRKRTRLRFSSSSESEGETTESSESDRSDSEEELRRAIKRLKEKKKAKKTKEKAKGMKEKERGKEKEKIPVKNGNHTTERGESSRQRARCNYRKEDDALRNANDIGAGFEERSPPRTGGLRFGVPYNNNEQQGEEPKTPMENGHKGLAAKCFREGIIDYCLSTQKILSSKKVFLLRKICQKKGIRYTKKPEIIDVLAREQVMLAYEGFEENEGTEDDSEQATDGGRNHPHSQYANVKEQACTCRGSGLPTIGGHVMTRVSDLSDIPDFVRNAKNVTCNTQEKCDEYCTQAILVATNHLNSRPEEVTVPMGGFLNGSNETGENGAWSEAAVASWAKRFSGFVLAPIDRNQGDTAMLCPILYRHAFGKVFAWNADYARVEAGEKEVLMEARRHFEGEGLQRVAEWKKDGRIGRAYVIPKDKDLTRWRPIAPATGDPAGQAKKRLARALHYLMKMFPAKQSFYLNSIQELPARLQATTKRLTEAQCTRAEGRCYDIKDMFTRIPHAAVRKAVWQLLVWYANREWKQVKVSRRGKMCVLSKTCKKTDGYAGINFKLMLGMVNFDLKHAYITCGEEIRRQVAGIPMGKSTSPVQATITCAMAEFNFLSGLGSDRRLIGGWRIVDDITVIVGRRPEGGEVDKEQGDRLFQALESSYDNNLHLIKKDESKD
ncbi:hypothetical protein CBR_g5574 [Chara braunii]|uniref:CCHC-type domain-containing protein n=1 Tax=Chara braunii TaxID=69332 RepID=A0A388JRJ4_CHABU|nr:hypothetical protein CBR_g5574 [Chara braunii]|eukprot:GBG60397.1 hypothetical protein CBR_g5574 [Chara braunii]